MDPEKMWDSINLEHPLIQDMAGAKMEFPKFFLPCHIDWVMGFFLKDDQAAFIKECNLLNNENTPLNLKYPTASKDPMCQSDSDLEDDLTYESPYFAKMRKEIYYGSLKDY